MQCAQITSIQMCINIIWVLIYSISDSVILLFTVYRLCYSQYLYHIIICTHIPRMCCCCGWTGQNLAFYAIVKIVRSEPPEKSTACTKNQYSLSTVKANRLWWLGQAKRKEGSSDQTCVYTEYWRDKPKKQIKTKIEKELRGLRVISWMKRKLGIEMSWDRLCLCQSAIKSLESWRRTVTFDHGVKRCFEWKFAVLIFITYHSKVHVHEEHIDLFFFSARQLLFASPDNNELQHDQLSRHCLLWYTLCWQTHFYTMFRNEKDY